MTHGFKIIFRFAIALCILSALAFILTWLFFNYYGEAPFIIVPSLDVHHLRIIRFISGVVFAQSILGTICMIYAAKTMQAQSAEFTSQIQELQKEIDGLKKLPQEKQYLVERVREFEQRLTALE